MRTLQLAITCISMSGKRVKAVAEIAYVSNALGVDVSGMDVSTPCCRLDVSVPYKEGNTLEQYETELKANAKEFVTGLYKELVCGGEMDSELVIGIQGKCTTGYNVKVIRKNGKLELTAPQLALYDIAESGVSSIHTIGKKAAEDVENPQDCDSIQTWGWGFRLSWPDGVLKVHEGENEVEPNISHRNEIIAKTIAELQRLEKGTIKQLGRSMALLQIAAEIELSRISCKDCRERMLLEIDNPPLKMPYSGWIAPGVDYLNGRLRVKN